MRPASFASPFERFFCVSHPYLLYFVVVVTSPYPFLDSHASLWYGTETASIWVTLPNRRTFCDHMPPGFAILSCIPIGGHLRTG